MMVFLDTNVWMSATIFPGLCEELVQQCAERGWLLSSALPAHQATVGTKNSALIRSPRAFT